ncbi:PDR/VanB family oxidoreductase [Nocardioides zeae]|uniref:PDR/VanB family oxidoreductase n=1 Tax=Nocardioides imazamoxiresistens TaxID=3231893 RepID=A0ABU3PSH1_9ACTN|nr:PDR/VanB family oxidoreductase [Nocardioides zeae]MDT9592138.1 PDR/VanB family oxidoreductase [Nocardioides zeae]
MSDVAVRGAQGAVDIEQVRRLRVARKEQVATDVVVLDLVDPDGAEVPAWAPGAHVDLVLPGDLVRQYSLCGDPADRTRLQVGVLREAEGRGGSLYLHDTLTEGDVLEVRGPRNNFRLEPAGSYVFVAGGIGVTPLIPMVAEAIAREIPFEVMYGGRTRSSMSYVDHLEALCGERVSVRPQDEHGLLDLAGLLGEPREDAAIYCCGPEPLLQAVEAASAAWPTGALHLERFSPKELEAPVLAGSFEVELTLSGEVLTVPPDRSIMAVVEEAGVPIVASCLEGTCGSCETVILEGEADHRDSILTAAEQEANETMMICVSRAACPRLVLEL